MKKTLILLCMAIGILSAQGLIVNGDFEQNLSVGWQQASNNPTFQIYRYTYFDPDPDYEVFVYKYNSDGYISLFQSVNVANTNLNFACYAKFYTFDNNIGDWSGAAVVISYINAADVTLGETRICSFSDSDCPWANSPTLHLITVTDTNWHDFFLNINDELANLSAVNPLEISKIQVALFDTTEFCDS